MRATNSFFASIILLSSISSIAAADPLSPRDELFRLVPEDTNFCVAIQNLRQQSAKFAENSFADYLAKMPLIEKSMQSPDVRKMMQIFKELKITPEQLRDEIFGDAVVFAFRQPTGKQPNGQDEGVFLIWARDKVLLKNLIDNINTFQKKSGELKEVQENKYKNQTYFRRSKEKAKGVDEFYFLRDNVLAFSTQEEVLKRVIEIDLTAKPVGIQAPLWTTRHAQLGLEQPLFAWMVNPRAFDNDLRERAEKAPGSQKAFLQEFEKYWQAIDGLAFSINLQKDLEINFSVRVRTEDLPKSAQKFFRELGKSSEVWKAIPEDALFAMGSRIEIATLTEVFAGFCDEPTRKIVSSAIMSASDKYLGRGNLDSLALGLGPDWGFWIAPPDTKEKTWIPQFGFALKVNDSESGKKTEKTILAGLNRLLVFAEFTPGVTVETIKQGEIEVRSIFHEQSFPPGFKPSFASKNHYLLFASSPGVIERFELRSSSPVKTDGEVPVLQISAKSWQEYLKNHRKDIADFFARTHQSKADLLLPQIDAIAENLKGFDRFEITTRSQPNQAVLTLRLKGRPNK